MSPRRKQAELGGGERIRALADELHARWRDRQEGRWSRAGQENGESTTQTGDG